MRQNNLKSLGANMRTNILLKINMKDLTFKNAYTKSNGKLQIKFNITIFIKIKISKEKTIQLVSLVNAFSFEILGFKIMK